MANRAAGKGYENVAHYENIDFHFIGIENIHAMRQSLQKMIEGNTSYFQQKLTETYFQLKVNILLKRNNIFLIIK